MPSSSFLVLAFTVLWSFQSYMWGLSKPSPFQWLILLRVSGPSWLLRTSGIQLLPIQFLAHCSLRRLISKPSVLHAALHSPAMLGGAPKYLFHATFYSS